MRLTLLVVIVFLGISDVKGQIGVPIQTIIKYRDGSIFQGQVIEEDPSVIKFLATTEDTLNIRKIFMKKRWEVSENVVMRDRGKFYYKKGFFGSFSLGQALAQDPSSHFDFIFGKRINEIHTVGVGFGFHLNEISTNGTWRNNDFLPVYLYGRRYLNQRNSGAFISARLGYAFPLPDNFGIEDFSGGFYAEPGAGFHFASRGKIRYLLSISQYIQHTKGEEQFTDGFANPIHVRRSTWFFRPVLKFGIEFR